MSAVLVGEAGALDACEKLVDLHAWPSGKINAQGWLQNFNDADRTYASHMLARFIFFSDDITDALFRSAFHSLSNRLRGGWRDRTAANQLWNDFLNSALITIVQGEVPNLSDSGFIFARKARQVLGLPETQLVNPDELLKAIADGFPGPIVFVDDFVGSGEQFITTWKRKRQISGYGRIAFNDMNLKPGQLVYYCNAILTEAGKKRISHDCPTVVLSTGNVIPAHYSWTSDSSLLWPDDARTEGIAFIRRVSATLGFVEDNGGERDWEGFHKLGLGLAFEHSTPDATLPIFHCPVGWRPLVRR